MKHGDLFKLKSIFKGASPLFDTTFLQDVEVESKSTCDRISRKQKISRKHSRFKKIRILLLKSSGSFTNSITTNPWIFSTKMNNQFVTSNHQTTNLVFPIFFHEIFSVEQLKKITNFLLVQNSFFSVLDQWKVCFLFELLNWENFVGKIGENKIRGLVVRCHELITNFMQLFKADATILIFFLTYLITSRRSLSWGWTAATGCRSFDNFFA